MKKKIKKKQAPSKIRPIMLIVSIAAILALFTYDLVIYNNFKADSRVILHCPVANRSYPLKFDAAGFAWDRNSIEKGKDIEVSVILKRLSDGKTLVFKATRSAVKNGSQVLFRLAAFSSPITLPESGSAGEWTASAKMTTEAGLTLETAPRRFTVNPQIQNNTFRIFSISHIITIFIIFAGALAVFYLFGGGRNKQYRPYFSAVLVIVIYINELIYHWNWSTIGAWTPTISLMLHMCGLAVLLIPFAAFVKNEKTRIILAELLYFWGLGGAVQAILTPDISVHGFPELKYFSFFISHGLIVLSSIYILLAYDIRIRFSSFIRVIVLTNIVIGFIFIINNLLKLIPPFETGNYFVVGYPPPDGSVIDLFVRIFGPSPWYLIGLEIMGLMVFGLLFLPFLFFRKKAVNQKRKASKLIEVNEQNPD